jgi:hypothetical protein
MSRSASSRQSSSTHNSFRLRFKDLQTPMSEHPHKPRSGRFREPLHRTFKQWQRSLPKYAFCLLVLATTSTSNAVAQKMSQPDQQLATVTFYAQGSQLTSGLPGSKHGIFTGRIFDGKEALVTFHEGFIGHNGRFITLQLPAGPHDFAATNGTHAKPEEHLALTVLPGQQYFLRAQNESSGFVIVESEKARLDQRTCALAHGDAPQAKPLQPKHPPAALPAQRISIEEMPSCQ